MTGSPMKRPSALVPLGMSLAALALVLGHAALYGIVPEADDAARAIFAAKRHMPKYKP